MAGRHAQQESSNHGRSRHRLAAIAVVATLAIAGGAAMALTSPGEAILTALRPSQNAAAPSDERDASTSVDDPSADASAATDASGSATDDSSSATVASAPEDETPLDTSASAATSTTTSASGISVTAPNGFTSTPTYQHLEDVVATFTGNGYHLGFSLVDLKTGRSVSYNAQQAFYPASSIKAAYCTAVLESSGRAAATQSADVITNCLVNSDNDAFRSLIATYGRRLFGDWLKDHAPEASAEGYVYNYPHISAEGMLGCWEEVYRFGTSGKDGAELLASCLSKTNHSAWGALLRGRYTVWSKPGWYPTNEGLASTATADDAIVFSDCGDYAVAVLSDAPSDFSALLPVLDALNAAHGKMCGGSSALAQTSATAVG